MKATLLALWIIVPFFAFAQKDVKPAKTGKENQETQPKNEVKTQTGTTQQGSTQTMPAEGGLVKWYTLAEAQELAKTTPKKLFIDMYTDWCGWCKKMDRETFENPAIAQYLNTYFYPVKFNAETKDTLLFKGKKYANTQTGQRPSHSLAIELLNGKMSYPTIVYLDENMNLLSAVPGYMTPRDIEPVLIFFGRNIFRATSYEEFKDYFSKTFIDSTGLKKFPVSYLSFEEQALQNQTQPRQSIIYLTADWCGECKIMENTTFSDSIISSYLNRNFHIIRFNALEKDSVVFNNLTYKNQNGTHPFHDLAVTLLNGKMDFPVMVFMDEKNVLVSPVPGYFSPKNLEPVLHFFHEKAYTTTPWEKYIQTFKSSY